MVRQQHRLNTAQQAQLVAGYEAGATVYELADQFKINRRTVSHHLKRQGVTLRRQPPAIEEVDQMVRLYESGLSLARVGEQLGLWLGSVSSLALMARPC